MQLANYLWSVHAGEGFGPASGISAMPSLQIATICWMLIASFIFARRWFVPAAILSLLIFLLSISLGWHYAVDGVAGAAAALLCYRLSLSFYTRRMESRRPAVVVG